MSALGWHFFIGAPQQAARQVMRVLHQPRAVSGVLAAGDQSRPLWQRVAQQ